MSSVHTAQRNHRFMRDTPFPIIIIDLLPFNKNCVSISTKMPYVSEMKLNSNRSNGHLYGALKDGGRFMPCICHELSLLLTIFHIKNQMMLLVSNAVMIEMKMFAIGGKVFAM